MRRFIPLITLLFSSVTLAQNHLASSVDDDSFKDLSIEDLLKIKIYSATKSEQNAVTVPAAIHVITAEDIRRSGATSIPEALRLAPGVNVAKVDANKWAISIRGFNSRLSNKLLVLLDGRSIYDPLYSGTFWETKDVVLEDVERIEVVRGPGGTLWGANAMNGVINIVTKSAEQTQGGLVSIGAGNELESYALIRQGFQLGDNKYLRVYGQTTSRDAGHLDGTNVDDSSRLSQIGFRFDSTGQEGEALTLQGNAYRGKFGEAPGIVTSDEDTSGVSLLGRYQTNLSGGTANLQFSLDHTKFEHVLLTEKRDTLDINFDHHLAPMGSHEITWGLQYRHTKDDTDQSAFIRLIPASRSDEVIGGFVEDNIALIKDKMFFSLGSKWEDNDYTGNEFQPNARFSWQFGDGSLYWASVSQAVRTPSRLESDFAITFGGVTYLGGKNVDAEEMTAYETGIRFSPMDKSYLDISVFYNNYDKLFSIEALTTANNTNALSRGFEVLFNYIPNERWQWTASFSRLNLNVDLDSGSIAPVTTTDSIEGSSPKNQAYLRLSNTSFYNYQLDFTLRYTGELEYGSVPDYTVADFRISRQIGSNIGLSLVGQNLLHGDHQEFNSQYTEVEPSVYLKLDYRF